MHEYPITVHIIDMATKRAQESGAGSITRITLVIGDDAGYIGDSIRLYFDAIAKGTACEGAELVIHRVRPQLRCLQCGTLFYRKPFSFDCPDCGAQGGPSEIGKEFRIESIEVSPL